MFRYNDGGEIIEIIIREASGAKIESYKFQTSDINRANSILSSIKKKYGLSKPKQRDKDMDWLKKFWLSFKYNNYV